MRVLVTGHDGYIGGALLPQLLAAGHDVVGCDTYLFASCTLGPEGVEVPTIEADVRDLDVRDLAGFDAVVHLAAISNDPLGDLHPGTTDDVNHLAAVHLARASKAAGVERFVFSSSCSLYGAAGDEPLDERAAFNPVTPYGVSKVMAEAGISALADDGFSPTHLRNGTAYGFSPRLRIDLVVNNLAAFAVTTGEVLLKSDGSPLRPLVHIEDIARAFVAVLDAPREVVHDEAFNVGRTTENYRIREVAEIVGEVVEGSRVAFAAEAGPDKRNYRVDCDKIAAVLPAYQPTWTVRQGVEQLVAAYREHGLVADDVTSRRFLRIRHIEHLIAGGRLDDGLRWRPGARPERDVEVARG
jgi:nucleoside-diphosphate-sugar epimerase